MGEIKRTEKGIYYLEFLEGIKGIEERENLKEDNDCGVRAIASATGATYLEAYEFAKNKLGREYNEGVEGWIKKMEALAGLKFLNGYKFKTMKQYSHRYTISVEDFIKKHQTGIYIVGITGHVFTIYNSVVIGNKEDSLNTFHKIGTAFQIYKSNE